MIKVCLGFKKIIYIFFSDSAYKKYLTATYSYDYGNGGGSDYEKFQQHIQQLLL